MEHSPPRNRRTCWRKLILLSRGWSVLEIQKYLLKIGKSIVTDICIKISKISVNFSTLLGQIAGFWGKLLNLNRLLQPFHEKMIGLNSSTNSIRFSPNFSCIFLPFAIVLFILHQKEFYRGFCKFVDNNIRGILIWSWRLFHWKILKVLSSTVFWKTINFCKIFSCLEISLRKNGFVLEDKCWSY